MTMRAAHYETIDRQRPIGVDEALGFIGPYRLLAKVGQGGMGLVYKAVHREDASTFYAVKQMRGMAPNQLMFQRFQQEADVLARLNHPHIAAFSEVGYDAEWRPYLVMEFVDGLPLLEFARVHQLGLTERLRLFHQVCEAAAHAHRHGIVHRDLKPENILVTNQSLGPQVKVIDFGVAKLDGAVEGQALTQAGAVVGTLSHMSPEQAGYQDGPIDARSDVYTLGLVLYELIAGVLPFDRERLHRKPLFRQMRSLFEQPLATPAQRLRALPVAELARLAAERGVTGRQLLRAVNGPLAAVIANALAVDLGRRTADVAVLGAAVQQLLLQGLEPKRFSPAGLFRWVGLGASS